MALAFVQVQNNLSVAAGQTSLAVSITTTPGNLLVAFVREGTNNTDAFTISDSAGTNTWTQTTSGYANPNTTGRLGMFWSVAAAGVTSITANFTTGGGVTNTSITVLEFSGSAASPADGSVNDSPTTGTSETSGTLTTANANDVLIFGLGCGANQTSWTQGTSFTIPSNNVATGASGSNARCAVQYQIVSSTFNSTTSMTHSTSASQDGIFAAFSALSTFQPDEDSYIPPLPQAFDPSITVY